MLLGFENLGFRHLGVGLAANGGWLMEVGMSMESRLLDAARLVTGDDGVFDVAEFHPRGFAAAAGAGAGVGSLAGDSVSDSGLGGMIGGTGGAMAGMAGAAAARGLPMRICVAIAPSAVYLLEIHDALKFDDLSLFAKIEEPDLGVEVHGRIANQVVVVEDQKTGRTFEMEAPRLSPLRAGKVVGSLMAMSTGSVDEPR